MYEALFHSFYRDEALAGLKHAALYFERLVIPDENFLVAWGERYEYSRWVQFVPDEAREHLEYLSNHGVVQLLSTNDGSSPTPQQLAELVARELEATHGKRAYAPADARPLFEFLNLRPDAPQAIEVANQTSLFVGAFCLRATAGRAIPCVDNRIIFDTVLSGLRGVFELFRDSGALTPDEVAQAKSYYLMSRLFELRLPQVAFRNFDDVLEARYILRSELASLREAVRESAAHVPGNPWEPDFARSLEGHLERRVLPEVEALERKAKVSLLSAGMSVATAALSIGLQSLLPERLAGWLVGASSVSLVQALRKERERASSVVSSAPFGALLRLRKIL
jgi:hypothetical protein